MVRKKLIESQKSRDSQFRWRSASVTRLEGFSDAVFAFAITLLVVSLEVPKTYAHLIQTMKGFAAFAICFTFLVGIWYSHYTFFRRYALISPYTIVLNAILLFVVLFYVYPLKFLFTALISQFLQPGAVRLEDGSFADMISNSDMPTLMIIYGIGYIAVFVIFALLYIHAYRNREALELNPIESHMTKESIQRKFIYISVGILSILIASLNTPLASGFAGMVYCLIGPAASIHATRMARVRKKMLTE